jgi:integration host factor subunit beta
LFNVELVAKTQFENQIRNKPSQPAANRRQMTKAELVEEVARAAELNKRDAEVIVETVFDSIIGALHKGEKVELRGFGSFRTRERGPRRGRNPKTGEPVDVPAKRVPYFKPGKELKEYFTDVPEGGDKQSVDLAAPIAAPMGEPLAEPQSDKSGAADRGNADITSSNTSGAGVLTIDSSEAASEASAPPSESTSRPIDSTRPEDDDNQI